MVLHVQYRDLHFDYVDSRILDWLIAKRRLRLFFRPSEKRWISVSDDPVRGIGGEYSGSDRREHHKTRRHH